MNRRDRMISYTGTADINCVKEVMSFVENELKNDRISEDATCAILIVTDEIFSNICRHSGAGEARVEYKLDGDKLMLEFSDDGIEFNPLEYPVPELDAPIEEREVGGLGIFLVRKLMNDVSYERVNGENHLRVTTILL